MRHASVVVALVLTTAITTARGQDSETPAQAAAAQAASAVRSEIRELQRQLDEFEKSCAVGQVAASQANLRWLVVGRQLNWVSRSEAQARGIASAGFSVGTNQSSRWTGGALSSAAAQSLAASSGAASQVPFLVPNTGAAVPFGFNTTPAFRGFSSVGVSTLPASPYLAHPSYDIYSQGAFTHSVSPAVTGQSGTGSAVTVYPTEQFRSTTGGTVFMPVPRWAVP